MTTALAKQVHALPETDKSAITSLAKPFGEKSIPTSYVYGIDKTVLTPIERAFMENTVGYTHFEGEALASGAEIFSRIEGHDDYYVGSAEEQLLEDCGVVRLADGAVITEFGPGDGQKADIILGRNENQRDLRYQAVDVSQDFLEMTARRLQGHRSLGQSPRTLCDDFFTATHGFERADIGLFLGTTISNFDPEEGVRLLHHIRRSYMSEDGVLYIGQDGNRDITSLLKCYDDSDKHTAAFVMNALRQIARDHAPDLDLNNFRYQAFFDEEMEAMRMGIVSETAQIHSIAGETIAFGEGEFIQIGQSRKYARHTIAEMAERAGFTTEYVVSSPQDVNIHRLRVAKGLDL